jgi:hypothetical protein
MTRSPGSGAREKRPSLPLPARHTAAIGAGSTRAFNPKDNQRRGRLNIRRKHGMSHAPGYNFIIDICYDEDHYSGILLILSTMLVKIRGRNLKPIADALLLGTCEYIQEFRDDIFDKPDDPAAPFDEAIEVVTGREEKPLNNP